MQANEAMLFVVKSSGESLVSISQRLGRSNNYLSSHTARKSTPKADTLAEIVDACGYDLLMRNRETGEETIIDPPKKDNKT